MCSILTSQYLKHGNIQLDTKVHIVMHACNEFLVKTPNFSLLFVKIVCGVLSYAWNSPMASGQHILRLFRICAHRSWRQYRSMQCIMMQSCAFMYSVAKKGLVFTCVFVWLCICVATYLCASKCNLVWSVRGNLATTCSEVSAPCLRSVQCVEHVLWRVWCCARCPARVCLKWTACDPIQLMWTNVLEVRTIETHWKNMLYWET